MMDRPSFGELFRTFLRIGLLSFGGPAGQIALMHRVLVEEKRWLDEPLYLRGLNFCMLLPGPEAMQLATYAGWRLHGVKGGLAAGLLFVLPGAVVVLALAALYATFGKLPLVEALFLGVKAAVLAIVIEALLRVARRALKGPADWAIAVCAFLALFVLGLPFPLVIAAAALVGFVTPQPVPASAASHSPGSSLRSTAGTVLLWLAIWLSPLAALALLLGPDHVLVVAGVFFSKLAVVTFGGAYAVLAYMAQQAVEVHGWLDAREMVDGLGLAETTPGPLILVTEFVGYLAGHRAIGGFWGGLAGALVTLWMTFAPCFLWIFAAAPYVEGLSALPRLSGALTAITAAVVGVIANLTLWFALHVLFGSVGSLPVGLSGMPWPVWSTIDRAALALLAAAAFVLFRLRAGIPLTLAFSAVLGVAWRYFVV
ncbi:MAG: chromate efflux transporter [Parvibaculaceae bacterium]